MFVFAKSTLRPHQQQILTCDLYLECYLDDKISSMDSAVSRSILVISVALIVIESQDVS